MGIVTLVSGGVDSTLMSLFAHEERVELFPLFVDYGQLGVSKEWEACRQVHEEFGLPEVTYMDLSGFGEVIPSGITDPRLRINEDAFLPGRNLLFVLAGAAYALKVQADSVAIGLLYQSDHIFPDQDEQFIEKCEEIIKVAMGKHINIIAPLIELSKTDVLIMARARGLESTYSCHAGGDEPCGLCIACVEINSARQIRNHGW